MKHITEQLHILGQTICLTDREKSAMRHFLKAVVLQYPVAHATPAHHGWVSRAFVVALSVVLIVGGISYTAERSMPGQALYTIKTSINEKVRDYVPVSLEAEMNWELTKQERRLAELEVLAAEYGF
ncbi:MAG: hypothetical protein AAB864_02445 [Patescibacteria group bacterium]